jgi:integrase/recombinase XerD
VSGQIAMTPADIFCEMQNSNNTKRAYRNDIKKWYQFIDSVGGGETPDNAIAFKNALVNVYAPATAQRVFCTVAAFYGWMKGTGKIESSPFYGLKSPTRPSNEPPPVPSDEDIAKCLNATENGTLYGSRARVIYELLLNGLRAAEVAHARKEHIVPDPNTEGRWILNVLGKGDKWRPVPLTSRAQQAIFEFFLSHKTDVTWLVPNIEYAGQQVTPQAIYNTVTFFAKQAGVEGMHPHALRHHYATRLNRAGVDLFTLKKLLGHERSDTTQRYVGLDYTDLNRALDVDPLHKETEAHLALFNDEIVSEDENVPF